MRFLFLFIFVLVTGLCFSYSSVDAVSITLKRIVFEGSKRSQVLTVINQSPENEVVTYRVTWRHLKMTENDHLVDITDKVGWEDQVSPSKDMIRFSPRRFTLAAGQSQQIRLMLRMPAGVADGEYRSHLAIIPEPPVRSVKNKRTAGTGGMAVALKMLTGITVPVIVRKGALMAEIGIESLTANAVDGNIKVDFMATRTGEKSSYGSLDFVCNEGGDEYLIKFIRGYAVYPEVGRRNASFKIPKDATKPTCSRMTVRYTETDAKGLKAGDVLAEAQVVVQ